MPETAQPAPETDDKKSRGLGSYVVWAFVAVMVYVLSSGPVWKLVGTRFHNFTTVYRPLWWAYRNTRLRKPIGMYWHIWQPALFDKNGDFMPVIPLEMWS